MQICSFLGHFLSFGGIQPALYNILATWRQRKQAVNTKLTFCIITLELV